MIKEIVDGEFEIRHGLNGLLDDLTLPEGNLVVLAEEARIDLGENHKARLNYLVALGILQKPKPVQFGKGKGGTRIFQRDALECLEFVQEQREHLSFNDLKDVFIERRNDLVRKACRELNIENDTPDSNIEKAARTDANLKALFNYDLIKADVLSLKLDLLHRLLQDAELEINALKSCHEELKASLCGDCEPGLKRYIADKESQQQTLLDVMKRDLEAGKVLLPRMEG